MSYRVSPLHPAGLGNRFAYDGVRTTVKLFLRTAFRMRWADVHALPPEGPVIVAANHRSFLDPLVLGSVMDRRSYFIMHAKYYDHPMLNAFFRMARCIPVDDDADNRTALRESQKVLDAGRVLGIFPEGHISPDGALQPAQPGLAWLARKSGAPVIPVHIGGTREAFRKGEWKLRFAPITVRTGEALYISGYPPGKHGNRLFTDTVMERIARLGGVEHELPSLKALTQS